MTRKDYTLIAYHLAYEEPADNEPKARAAWSACCKAVADAFESDNSRFDRSRFSSACKLSYWKDRQPPR